MAERAAAARISKGVNFRVSHGISCPFAKVVRLPRRAKIGVVSKVPADLESASGIAPGLGAELFLLSYGEPANTSPRKTFRVPAIKLR